MRLINEETEISKQEYELYKDAAYEDQRDFVENIAIKSLFYPIVYGFGNVDFCEKGNKYYATWSHYDSCD